MRHTHSIKKTQIIRTDNNKDKDVEQLKSSFTATENTNQYNHYGEVFGNIKA